MTNSIYYCSYLDPEMLENGELLEYAPDIKRYWFIVYEHGQDSGVKQPLLYCPWCGKSCQKL